MSLLICFDGSPSARYAVKNAARAMEEAVCSRNDVTVLCVWDEPFAVPTDSSCFREDPAGPSAEHLLDLAEGRATEVVQEGRRLAVNHRLMPHTMVACNISTAAATILRVADEQDASLIIVGAHTRNSRTDAREHI